MNKKIGSLLLAFALPLTSCNFNTCSAYDYQYYESGSFSYAQKRELEEEIKRLQHSVDNLEKEKEIKHLQEKLQYLQKGHKNQKNSSFWASTKRTFKNFFSTKLGAFGSTCATVGLLATLALAYTGVFAIFECHNDDKCHFNDKSFWKKFNTDTFKNSFSYLFKIFTECMKNVHSVNVNVNSDDED